MRKFVMVIALAVCTGLLLGGVVELDLIGDVQAQIKKPPSPKPPAKKKKDRCGTPDAACDPNGPAVRCHGCVYDSLECALSTGNWDENQCRNIRQGKRKIPGPPKKRPPKK